jgi:anti-sigma regulatory factor (Ser/Thr protein kinase)
MTVKVLQDIDAFTAREETKKVAEKLGFSKIAVAELKIVASELASNILKHTPGGEITIESCRDQQYGAGLCVTARDRGAPFRDLAGALRDGHDDSGKIEPAHLLRRRGIGGGLGAIWRMTDVFEYQLAPNGKYVRVIRFLARPRRRALGRSLPPGGFPF